MRDRDPDHVSPTRAEEVGRLTRGRLTEHLAATGIDSPQFLALVERFATALALWGSRINLTAIPDDPAELAFHMVDSLMPLLIATRPEGSVLRDVFAPGQSVLDLGSGAGFPGLILAAASECRFVLLESRRKRANFLRVTAAAMELANVEVDATRREPVDLAPTFDIVLGRAFAKPVHFYRSAAAALRPHGLALLYATPAQPLDLEAAAAAGLVDHLVVRYEVPRDRRPVARLLTLWRKRI